MTRSEMIVWGGCCCVWVWRSVMFRAIHPVSGRRDRELLVVLVLDECGDVSVNVFSIVGETICLR